MPETTTGSSPIDAIRRHVREAVALFDSLFGGLRGRLNVLAARAMAIEKKYGPGKISGEVWKKTLALRHAWNRIQQDDAADKNRAVADARARGGAVTVEFKPLLDGLDRETGDFSEPDSDPVVLRRMESDSETSGLGFAAAVAGGGVLVAIQVLAASALVAWLGAIVMRHEKTKGLIEENESAIKVFNEMLESGMTPNRAADVLNVALTRGGKGSGKFDWNKVTEALPYVAAGVLGVALLSRFGGKRGDS